MDPKEARFAGERILGSVLTPHRFQFRLINAGKGSGGSFAQAEFVKDDRRLELHFRYNLGLVRYHIGDMSASHEAYMRELGVQQQCQYPGYPEGALASFEHLAHDLSFAADFITGSGPILIRASRKEAVADVERRAALMAGYVGDTRKLEQLRVNFKQGHYDEAVKLCR